MNLIVVCAVAFLTVMLLLSALAFMIRLLTTVFPEPVPTESGGIDPATAAAIDATVSRQIPGARLRRVESNRND